MMKLRSAIGAIFIAFICVKIGFSLYHNYTGKLILENSTIIGELVKIEKRDTLTSSELSDPLPSIVPYGFDPISPTSTLAQFNDKDYVAKSFTDAKGNLYVIKNLNSIYKIEGDTSIIVYKDNESKITNTDIVKVAGRLYLITDAVYLVDGATLMKIGSRTDDFMRFLANRTKDQVYIIGMSESSSMANLFFINAQGKMETIGRFPEVYYYNPTAKGLIFSSQGQLYFFDKEKVGKIDMKNLVQEINNPVFYENNEGIYMLQRNDANLYKIIFR